MTELVFLLEEQSAREMLEGVIPRIGVACPVRFIVFEGKRDLEKHLTRRLKGYINSEARFIIVRDQDSAPDCKVIKSRLVSMCIDAGKEHFLVRIFCRELEAIYLADLKAVESALEIDGLARRQNEARFRQSDHLTSPSQELHKITKGKYQKVSGSREIGKHLDLDNMRCVSFKYLLHAIRKFSSSDGVPA